MSSNAYALRPRFPRPISTSVTCVAFPSPEAAAACLLFRRLAGLGAAPGGPGPPVAATVFGQPPQTYRPA